ncbi:MAG: hypothetical protein D6772_15235 [Bacteroidetes bacterium]|nr:MAG: hypothetical protein D6772_15235 [Bacteroidota bacterium]
MICTGKDASDCAIISKHLKTKKMTRCTYALLLALLLSVVACVDDPIELESYGRIEGQIVDLSTDLPLADVTITTTPVSLTLKSDADGKFVFDSLPVDNYQLRFRKDGYEDEALVAGLDEIAEVSLEIFMSRDYTSNLPPDIPSLRYPQNGAGLDELNVMLRWSGGDPNPEDSLTYDLLLFRGDETGAEQLLTGDPRDSFLVEGLAFSTTYSWQVVAHDGTNDPVYSPLWQFRINDRPDRPVLLVREDNDQFQIWMSSTTGDAIRLYNSFNTAWRPKRSPVGDRIAFLAFVGGNAHIFVSNSIGEEVRRVTTVPVGGYELADVSFSWSPEGDQLIYPSFEQLYIVNVDGTGLTELAQAPAGQIFEAVDWSLFNDRIVVRTQGDLSYENRLYQVAYPEGTLSLLVDDLPGTIGNPSLSIDGQRLLYSLDLSGLEVPSGRQNNASVILTDLSSTQPPINVSSFKPGGYNDLEPRFSPTEAEIIVSEWVTTETQVPNLVRISLGNLNLREVLVENARHHDWKE